MDKKAKIEAALFVSNEPLDLDKLSKFVGGDVYEAERIVNELMDECNDSGSGIELVKTPKGYEYRVKQEYRDNVVDIAPLSDLTEGMLRTLAIITAKEPIKQSTIVKYQGNKVYNYIKKLEEKGLIKTEKYKRTKLVRTSSGFERYFGKSVGEVRDMLNNRMGKRDKEVDEKANDKLEGEKNDV